jgi:hypothetical protein
VISSKRKSLNYSWQADLREEFYTGNETLDMDRFESIGVIKNEPFYNEKKLHGFIN